MAQHERLPHLADQHDIARTLIEGIGGDTERAEHIDDDRQPLRLSRAVQQAEL